MSSTSSIRWCRRRCATSAPASARCWSSRKAIPTTSSRRSTSNCAAPISRPACYGKDVLPQAGEYTSDVLLKGLAAFPRATRGRAGLDADAIVGAREAMLAHRPARRSRRSANCRRARRPSAPAARSGRCSPRIKLAQREIGPTHISADIGCHSLRDLRAVQHGQLDPRLRHVARERRGASGRTSTSGRSRSWATAASGITA